MRTECLFILILCSLPAFAAPKRVLYVTHSAGFVHGSIQISRIVLESAAARTGLLEVFSTDNLAFLEPESLRGFDVVFFFTSGELPLSERQKTGLLEFIRAGKGFGGVHSATDTLYTWPEYGELIGAIFHGHPWTQEVAIDIEDPEHPAMRHLTPSFRIADEIYQFREISRDRVRVLMTLDTRSVNLGAEGVGRDDGDFALAWCRPYGQGRVFYTALGHHDDTWRDQRFQTMLVNALLWLAGEATGDGAPRTAKPVIARGGVTSAAFASEAVFAPGALISIYGTDLTGGATLAAQTTPLPPKLAGTQVQLNGAPMPLHLVSPGQINAQVPFETTLGTASLVLESGTRATTAETIRIAAAAPGIFAVAGDPMRAGDTISIYATGLGAVRPSIATGVIAPLRPLSEAAEVPLVTMGGERAVVRYAGLAPLFVGLNQVNAVIPALPAGPSTIVLEAGGRRSNAFAVMITSPP